MTSYAHDTSSKAGASPEQRRTQDEGGTMSPFLVRGPAFMSFSGGRSSGKLLHEMILAYGGSLPDNIKVGFCNTGKEREETLDFVDEVDRRWKVGLVWLEYDPLACNATRVVDYQTASRNGGPFEALIGSKTMLPNRMASYCSIELKIRRMREYCVNWLGWEHWTSIVGYRADEQKRLAKLPKRNAARKDRWITVAPLADAGITNDDVLAFWGAHEFDLRLPVDEAGATFNGNCDNCFKKGVKKALIIARDDPDSLDWWIAREGTGRGRGPADFFRQQYTMAEIKRAALAGETPVKTRHAVKNEDEEEQDCACTD